jgi:NDP-sugar pyrophosphorylase family protein
MKAMIFAAGLGTRLRPLTDNCPKALVKVGNKPMLQHTIEHLIKHGFNEIILNIHYLGEQIIDFLQEHKNFGIRIEISDERAMILETGGGLLKAKKFFDDDKSFLVCNADIFTNINLTDFYNFHEKNKSIATLAVRSRSSSRYLLMDENDILCGWKNTKTHEIKNPRITNSSLQEFAFSGYQIVSPKIFDNCRFSGVFSMIDWYLDICNQHIIKAYHHDQDTWIDIGSQEQLDKANAIAL